jgi:hypothetical protein
MHQKKLNLLLDLKGPWRGLGAENPSKQCEPLGAKLKNSILQSRKFQNKPSSSKSLWAQKQATDSNIELIL